MKHTPIGYDIQNGRVVINEEEAEQVRQLFTGYLFGLSFQGAAEVAGLNGVNASQAKKMMHNRRYLGDENYPEIIDKETFEAAETERLRREKILGRDHLQKRQAPVFPVRTRFSLEKVSPKYGNKLKQAEYVYSQIKEVK